MQLPTKKGVSPSCIALPQGGWHTILDFLTDQFSTIPRDEWNARMTRGDVLDAEGNAILPAQPYRAQIKIYYYRSLTSEPPIPFEETVLYQDDYLVVADKPHFLPVTPAGRYLQQTLLVRLKNKLGIDTLTPMHRIDRETAGLVVFTIQPHTRGRYQTLFRDRAVIKQYEAIAPARPDLMFPMTYRSRLIESESFMQMQETEGEPNAETMVELLETKGSMARYRLHPTTGQKHQLRVQMAALGIPIMNDRIYPDHYPEFSDESGATEDYSKPLQLLAKSIRFADPVTGVTRYFESMRELVL